MSETVVAEVKRVTYESEETGFRVVQLELQGGESLTAVGKFQFVAVGTMVRLTGEVVQDPKHGQQLRVHTLVPLEPKTLEGIEKYLGSGLVPGIGPGLAKRIVEHFGLETLSVLDREPHRLGEVTGLGKRRRADICRHWKGQRAVGNLNLLLQTHGIAGPLARRIFEKYGERSAEVVQSSPYRLAMEVRGVGFKTADRIAETLGISRSHPERAQAGVFHELSQFADAGHVYAPRAILVQRTSELLGIDEGHVQAALDALWAGGRIVVEKAVVTSDPGADDAVFLSPFHNAEVMVTDRIVQLLSFPAIRLTGVEHAISTFERAGGVVLAPEQRRAVEITAEQKIAVITGGPGVGKTTIVRAVLSVFEQAKLTTKLAAPTGRAAKRLSESTGRQATTLHRLLEYDPVGRKFARNSENPLDAQALIIDEASMVELSLLRSLVQALPERARLVIVGDADQLPSVGAGAVLRDLIACQRLAVVSLTQVFRQAQQSRIVAGAHRILKGEEPLGADPGAPDADFFVISRTDQDKAARTVEELVLRRIPQRFGLSPTADIQVLCPMHRGTAGTTSLNQRLQAALNPSGAALTRSGQSFRQGDRVMQLRNDYEKEVFNGDQGIVKRVDESEGELSIEFEGREVPYTLAELDNVSLAYATSIHKSQGSEYPAVVIPLLTSHFVMLSRNLLYTAVTRARKLCVLVVDPRALRIALSETRKEQRNTRLAERLRASLG